MYVCDHYRYICGMNIYKTNDRFMTWTEPNSQLRQAVWLSHQSHASAHSSVKWQFLTHRTVCIKWHFICLYLQHIKCLSLYPVAAHKKYSLNVICCFCANTSTTAQLQKHLCFFQAILNIKKSRVFPSLYYFSTILYLLFKISE